MTYEKFLKVTLTLKRQGELLSELYEKNVDLIEFVDPYMQVITELIKEVYGDEGYEWWSWFCYEAEYGEKDWSKHSTYKRNEQGEIELVKDVDEIRWGATDENGNPICYSFESLYEYLENLRHRR